jgi:hypothetical protein
MVAVRGVAAAGGFGRFKKLFLRGGHLRPEREDGRSGIWGLSLKVLVRIKVKCLENGVHFDSPDIPATLDTAMELLRISEGRLDDDDAQFQLMQRKFTELCARSRLPEAQLTGFIKRVYM